LQLQGDHEISTAMRQDKVGRNDPCPCGSGKKHKKCCLDNDQAPMAGAGRSAAQVSESMVASAPGLPLTPYSVMKMTEEATRSEDAKLRRLVARHMRDQWTRAKVAQMTTENIEAQLCAYGVNHSRERFLALARTRLSAWTIASAWLDEDDVGCAGTKEEDFLGIAACELWQRWIPERPSTEMLDDWMQDGYELSQARDHARACDTWSKVWQVLVPRFERSMTTMHSVEPVFSGMQSVFNWSQDFETELQNAAVDDPRYAEIGRDYCRQWLAQFTDEDGDMKVSFLRALSDFLFRLGEAGEGQRILEDIVRRWPTNAWGYIALADAYSHIFKGASPLPVDMQRAEQILERGLAAVPKGDRDREVIEDRLRELHTRAREDESP
jgi:hypothetical protein